MEEIDKEEIAESIGMIIGYLILTSLIVGFIILGYTGYGWISCRIKDYTMQEDLKYRPFAGCFVRVGEVWIPLENYRVYGGKDEDGVN